MILRCTCSRATPLRTASRGLASLNMKERERTFIMVKPDAVQRGLVGNIISLVPFPTPLLLLNAVNIC